MATFTLPGNLSLLTEPAGKKLRLIITDGEQELACRMETPGKLKSFLASAEPRLFKGRLQLQKNGETVIVMLKGEEIGAIGMKELLEGFKALPQNKLPKKSSYITLPIFTT